MATKEQMTLSSIENTRNDVITLRTENPALTLQQIAIIVNRTRERVRQILVSENMETRSAKRVENSNRPNALCRICNTEIITGTVNKKRTPPSRKYCDSCINNNIWHIDRGMRSRKIPRVHIPCCHCNTIIDIRKTLYERHQRIYKNLFCSTPCRSKYLWDNKVLTNINGKITRGRIESDRDD